MLIRDYRNTLLSMLQLLILQELLPGGFFDFDVHFITPTNGFYFNSHILPLTNTKSTVSKVLTVFFINVIFVFLARVSKVIT